MTEPPSPSPSPSPDLPLRVGGGEGYKTRAVRSMDPPAPGTFILRGTDPTDTTAVGGKRRIGEQLAAVKAILRANAQLNHDIYHFWGISVWAAVSADDQTWVLQHKLSAFELVSRLDASSLAEAGVHVLATGDHPHHDAVLLTLAGQPAGDDPTLLEDLVDRVATIAHTVIVNPYHQGGAS